MALKLSILICSLHSRVEKRKDLLQLLRNSIGEHTAETTNENSYEIQRYTGAEVEIIVCTDNKAMTVGAKRNLLISLANGDYTVFIDDDDMVSVNYVSAIIEAWKYNSDVIVFRAVRYDGGVFDREVIYGKEYRRDSQTRKYYFRLPNHLMPVKRSISSQVKFPEISFGEDSAWAKDLLRSLNTQTTIPHILYEYWFDKKTTETQK